MVSLCLYRYDAYMWIFLLEKCRRASDCSPCSAPCNKMGNTTVGLLPYLRPCCLIMRQEIGIVFILIGHVIQIRPRLRDGPRKSYTLISTCSYPWAKIIRSFM